MRHSNGIRIIDRSGRRDGAAQGRSDIEHLLSWRRDDGAVVIVGLDLGCRPIYTTTLPPPAG